MGTAGISRALYKRAPAEKPAPVGSVNWSAAPYLYRARNRVERFFNRIKQCRRIATRYDRLAANYLAFVQLASIRLWLRFNECIA
jgi:transposase